jgi:hypothetical protein
MKGVVEIYGTREDGKKELIYQEENMTTVGFAENIVDMLTLPSSVSLTPTTSGYLDASNYTINAFSMAKPVDQYKKNLHEYSTDNLLDSSRDMDGSSWSRANLTFMSNVTEGYDFGTSGHRLVADSSGAVTRGAIMFDGVPGNFSEPWFSGTDFVASVDLKFDKDDPLVKITNSNEDPFYTSGNKYVSYSKLVLRSEKKLKDLFVRWDNTGAASLYTEGANANNKGGIKELGGGWYRVFVFGDGIPDLPPAILAPETVYLLIYPLGAELSDDAITTTDGVGSIFVSRPQIELGTHPTNYVETPGVINPRDDLLRYSRLNSTPPYGQDPIDPSRVAVNYYIVSGSGGSTLSGIYDGTLDKGVSAYIPDYKSLVDTANPLDRELVKGAVTPVEEAFGVQITKGQNSACQNLWDTLYVSSYDDSWAYTSSYKPVFGRHLTYAGTYSFTDDWVPSGVSATSDMSDSDNIKVRNWVHYVSAYDEDGMTNPLSSIALGSSPDGPRGLVTYASGYGIDRDGFISIVQPSVSGGPGDTDDTSDNWWSSEAGWLRPTMQTEIQPNFSSTGEISYHLRLLNMSGNSDYDFVKDASSHNDSVLLNLFGGANVLGLWGFDLKKMREDLVSEGLITTNADRYPYIEASQDIVGISNGTNTHKAYPWRKYKLFSKKVLTDNIFKNEGLGTTAGIFGNYTNLDLYWRIKLL